MERTLGIEKCPREAPPEGMHQQSGWEGKVMAVCCKGTTGKGDEGGRGITRQGGGVLREREQ